MAGVGNVFKSEVCFASGVNPFRNIGALTDGELSSLVSKARKFMGDSVAETSGVRRTTGRSDPSERLWVYKRRGEPCRKCGTPIKAKKQGDEARTTFWCPQCQPIKP